MWKRLFELVGKVTGLADPQTKRRACSEARDHRLVLRTGLCSFAVIPVYCFIASQASCSRFAAGCPYTHWASCFFAARHLASSAIFAAGHHSSSSACINGFWFVSAGSSFCSCVCFGFVADGSWFCCWTSFCFLTGPCIFWFVFVAGSWIYWFVFIAGSCFWFYSCFWFVVAGTCIYWVVFAAGSCIFGFVFVTGL